MEVETEVRVEVEVEVVQQRGAPSVALGSTVRWECSKKLSPPNSSRCRQMPIVSLAPNHQSESGV